MVIYDSGTPEALTPLVKITHARVPGRTRFEVPGLYRSPQMRQRLESRLQDSGLFQTIEANIVTGRLLLVYSRHTLLEDVFELVESLIDAPRTNRVRPTTPNETAIQENPDSDLRNTLYRIATTLDDITSQFMPKPLAAAVAGAVNLGEQVARGQDIQQWHLFKLAEVLKQLGVSDESGLSDEEVQQRLEQYGPNSLAAVERRSDLAILVEQFMNAPVAMLGASAVISVLTGGKSMPRSSWVL